ncbi:coiled-coil and C2 domain-containing protein 1-like isoform X2 [Ischnura elegans]|uniref:coiled-coil and C2 domain-containing protein 1-like isoform X2 n=1 Tax=Ischnura elegans TaxID=197161 RepID=UPI001ED88E2A|nr:coiled-coil and C2 domain-containing protein 1-like isoform X2 [Ischnura elegans]
MFARKKDDKSKRRSGGTPQLGIFGIPDDINNFNPEGGDDDSDDDEDLEAELLALTSGGAPKPRKPAPVKVQPQDLGIMVAASLKDIPSDDDVSVDEDDPDLMAELGELVEDPPETTESSTKSPTSPVAPAGSQLLSLLKERLQMYEKAEAHAKAAGEASRARRFSRGIKTLKEQLKSASAGKVVNEADIPPAVASGDRPKDNSQVRSEADGPISDPLPSEAPQSLPPAISPTVPTPALDSNAPTTPQGSEDIVLTTLNERRNAYRHEAVSAKKNGDNESALKYVRIVKQFDSVIAAVKSGQPVDLSEMPPMPHKAPSVPLVPVREAPKPPPRMRTSLVTKSEPQENAEEEVANEPPPPQKAPPPPPPPAPSSVLEALEQRLQRFKEAEQSAKEEGNSSKARRLGRIVKQYQTAINDHKKGKPVPFDELPTPPGFAPIPGQPIPKPDDDSEPMTSGENLPEEPAKPAVTPNKPAPSPSSVAQSGKIATPSPVSGPGNQSTRLDRQYDVLIKRQAAFKKAALEAKKRGDVAQAREHLRNAKGIDPLIEATQNGLPVDMDTLPLPPEEKAALLETDFDFVSVEECIPGSIAEIYERLEEDLSKQVMMCMNTRDHFRAIGDVSSGNRFEQMASHSKKDLDAVRAANTAYKMEASNKGEDEVMKTAPPRFHYENKTFSIVQCNTDLSDNDVELTIIRGINFNIPNDSDTYVRFEFPYPTETPQKDKTQTVRGNNPSYEQSFTLSMQRSARPCQRIFKRHSVKLELWSRGGFFRGDSLIGTATVKLQPLETVCTLHDSFPLMEGRKAVGGKLEVKIKLRNPILARQVEKVNEKWLVIDRL